VQVNGVEDILDQCVHDDGEQDGVLKSEDQLDAGALGQSRGVCVLDEKGVQRGKHQGKREDPEMKDETDYWASLHVVHSLLCQPVKGFEKEKQSEESHKLG